MAKRKTPKQPEGLFPTPAFPNIGEDPAPVAEAAPAEGDVNSRIAALEASLRASEARASQLQAAHLQVLAARQNTPAAVPAQATVPAEPDLNGLPDPAVDLQAYLREYHKRVNAHTAAVQAARDAANAAAQTETTTNEQRINALWERLLEKHEDVAGASEIISAQASKIVKSWTDQGLDPTRAMLADSEGFIDRVAEGTRKRMQELGLSAEDEAEDEIAVASMPSNSPRAVLGKPAAKEPPGLVDQIREVQKKSGLF